MGNDELATAWQAVSDRLVAEGFAGDTVASTMLKVALRSSIERFGCNKTLAELVETLRELGPGDLKLAA